MLAEAVRGIAELRPRRPGQSLLVLVATRHVAHALEQALLEANFATAGVAILTPGQAVRRVLALRGAAAQGDVSLGALSAWLLDVLDDLQREAPLLVSRELRELLRFPTARRDFLGALRTLRLGEAAYGVPAGELLAAGEDSTLGHFLPLLDQALAQAGLADAALRLRSAMQALAARHASDPDAVLVCRSGQHEVPELVGLLRAVRCPVHVVAAGAAPAEAGKLASRAAAIFAPRPPKGPVAVGTFRVFRTRGDEGELREACRRARALVESGTPPHRIAILAPRLGPFEPWIASACRREGLPFTTTSARPLAEEPAASLARHLVALVTADLPRGALCATLGHPSFAAPAWLATAGGGSPFAAAGALDLATRDAHCLGGRDAILAALPGKGALWQEPERGALAAFLAELGLCRERLRTARTAAVEAQELERLLLDHVTGDEGGALAARAALLAQWTALDQAPLPLEALGEAFDALLGEATQPVPGQCADGVLVAPLERAHGRAFDHVLLLGLNRDVWPSPMPDRPYLRAPLVARWAELARPARAALPSEACRDQLPLLATLEEREQAAALALVELVQQVHGTLTVSFQHSGSNGQVRLPSPWLRRIGQAMTGIGGLEDLLADPAWTQTAPWSPRDRVEACLVAGDAWPHGEALLAAAVLGGGDALREQAARLDAQTAALCRSACDWLAERDSFVPGPSRFDALSLGGARLEDRSLSVSAFRQVGMCPLLYWFERGLGAKPLPDEPRPDSLSSRNLGMAVHALLFDVLRDLRDAGHFTAGRPIETVLAAAGDRIAAALRDRQPQLLTAQARYLPLLGEHVLHEWERALRQILALDLVECWASGFRPAELEHRIVAEVDLGQEVRLGLRGQIDRLDRDGAGAARILDYKTGGSYDGAKPIGREPLQGQDLQLPLYVLMLEALERTRAAAELRGVAPRLLPSESELPRRVLGDKLLQGELRQGLLETLRVLHGLLVAGHYPFRSGEHCDFCRFHGACPRHHPPARHRQERSAAVAAFRSLSRKSTRTPLLADFGIAAPDEAEDEA